MEIYREVKKHYENSFGQKTLVVSTEAESLQIKEILFNLGANIVSDQDVVTLDYLLTQKLIQDEGLKIVDDFLYPYTFNNKVDVKDALDYIKWVKNFPDPFVESEVFDVLREYFLENNELNYRTKLDLIFKFVNKAFQRKVIPRSFIKLCLNKVLKSNKYIFLESLLLNLPVGFEEQFIGSILKLQQKTVQWQTQLELCTVLKENKVEFEFSNFSSQIEEVRFVLNKMSKGLKKNQSLFLYPKNQGYENLFFVYQREFFKEQVFFYSKREQSFIKDCIKKLKNKIEIIETSYGYKFKSKNIINISKKEDVKISYEEVLEFFQGRFTEYDLNLLSPIASQIGFKHLMPISSWVRILSEIDNREESKFKKIFTKLPIQDYTYFPVQEVEEIYVLGWNESLFKRNGEQIFTNTTLLGLQRDLGMDFPSLNHNYAKELMKNPMMLNQNVLKHILYSEKMATGSSLKPGVFKMLYDEEKKELSTNRKKVKKKEGLNFNRSRLEYTDNKISASSLQKYDECPYKFYLEKVLGLNFEADEDYFLSPKEEGLLIHKALEEVDNKNLTENKFKELLEGMIYTKKEELNYFRKGSLDFFVKHLWKIIESENKYIKDQGVKKIESERFFSFFVNLKEKTFVKNHGDYNVVGVIDRMDIFKEDEVFLYDYKRAGTGSVSLTRYTGSKLSPQLFLYCIALDKGFMGEFKDFLGFQYINAKAYKRVKGFVSKGSGEKFAKEVPQGSAVTIEKYEEKLELFLVKFWQTLEKISNNVFNEKPNPVYSKICLSCEWVGICKKSETFQ